MTTPVPQLHPLPDVAKRYQLKLRPLRERARREEFDHILIGRERYMTDDQIAAFLAANTVTSKRSDDLAKTRERVARRVPRQRRKAA